MLAFLRFSGKLKERTMRGIRKGAFSFLAYSGCTACSPYHCVCSRFTISQGYWRSAWSAFEWHAIVIARLLHNAIASTRDLERHETANAPHGSFFNSRLCYAHVSFKGSLHSIAIQTLMRLLAPGRALFNACSFLKTGVMLCTRAIQDVFLFAEDSIHYRPITSCLIFS